MLIRCLPLSVWRKSGPAQFCPSPSTKYNWCWKIWGGEKTDRVGKKLTGYFFLPGKKLTSQFLPRGRNGPAWSFPGERLAVGKNWPLHRLLWYVIYHMRQSCVFDVCDTFICQSDCHITSRTSVKSFNLITCISFAERLPWIGWII